MSSKNNFEFGVIDSQSGEFQEGYYEKGEMKYRSPIGEKWYHKLFKIRPKNKLDLWEEPVFVQRTQGKQSVLMTNGFGGVIGRKQYDVTLEIYSEKNCITGQKRYFHRSNYGHIKYIQTKSFENKGEIIERL
jgi:hypothetical protein